MVIAESRKQIATCGQCEHYCEEWCNKIEECAEPGDLPCVHFERSREDG